MATLLRVRREEAEPYGLASGPPRTLQRYKADKYWEENGWILDSDDRELHGYYRTMRQSFRGRVDLDGTGDHRYFITDPPSGLKHHPHGACFMYQGDGWHWVHFNVKPLNVDAGIVSIETILREAIEMQ